MALKLVSKTPVKFQWTDDLSETAVIVSPDDDSETITAKLQRVLELEAPQLRAALLSTGAVSPNALRAPAEPTFTPADRAATDARMAAVQTSGWNEDADMDNLPEYG